MSTVPASRGAILFDDRLAGEPHEDWFAPQFWQQRNAIRGTAGGRGTVLFVDWQGTNWVLRHYQRGGYVGRLLYDHFLWLGASRTRSFHEWQLLRTLRGLDLPVPQPVAACYARRYLAYTADILTIRIDGAEPLSRRLSRSRLPREVWAGIGSGIRRFHDADVYHADLTAHNILLDEAGRMHLLDFDRGGLRSGRGWRQANLERLLRSLNKISVGVGSVAFAPGDWEWLLEGYADA